MSKLVWHWLIQFWHTVKQMCIGDSLQRRTVPCWRGDIQSCMELQCAFAVTWGWCYTLHTYFLTEIMHTTRCNERCMLFTLHSGGQSCLSSTECEVMCLEALLCGPPNELQSAVSCRRRPQGSTDRKLIPSCTSMVLGVALVL